MQGVDYQIGRSRSTNRFRIFVCGFTILSFFFPKRQFYKQFFFANRSALKVLNLIQKCTVQKIDRAIFDSSNPDSYVFLFTVRLLSRPISPTKGGLQKKFTTISFEPFPVIVCHNNSHYYSRWGRLSL